MPRTGPTSLAMEAKRELAIIDDLPLFTATPAPVSTPPAPSDVEERLKAVHPDELSPRDALALIYELRSKL